MISHTLEPLAVIADVHANVLALGAVIADARRKGISRFLHLGDMLYGPLWPRATYDLLREVGAGLSIVGNQDRFLYEGEAGLTTLDFVREDLGAEPISWVESLPPVAVFEEQIFLCHGTPASDTDYLLEDVTNGAAAMRKDEAIANLLASVTQQLVLCGHSHVPRVVALRNGQTVVNPGSVGLPAYFDDSPVEHVIETYSPHASYAILSGGPGQWSVSLERVVYDWNRAGARARELGRPDWAIGLETGRMR